MKDLRKKLESLYSKSDEPKNQADASGTIRSELDRLFSHKDGVKYFAESQIEKDIRSISDFVQGSWINTHFGDIFRAEFDYPLIDLYGNLDLKAIYNFSSSDISAVFQIEIPGNVEKLLFVDTETTGLSGGAGTVAFLVGLGWLAGDRFIVHQYFITQLNHEEGMLELIRKLIPNFDCIVTYNGKSYDIPLLNSRFIMNRMSPPFDNLSHIDLLHPTRTLWKLSMENCKLKTVETDLLGLYREDDIPGEMIPDVYFDYLRNRRAEKIERIFYHNRFDVITMLANLILIVRTQLSSEPAENPLTDFAKAKLFTRKKDIDRSINHYQHVLDSDISGSRRQKTYIELAALFKKVQKFDEAIRYWNLALNSQFPFMLEPYVELAKYYEHRQNKYAKAIKICQSALKELPVHRDKEKLQIEKRINRLYGKLQSKTRANRSANGK